MREIDFIKPNDEVKIVIWGPDGNRLFESTNSGFHNLEMAVNNAVADSKLEINPEDCVFEISNLTTGITHRYRLNAHSHLKLII